MKILILQDDFPPYEFGGAGVIANLIAKGFVNNGHEVFVITTVQEKKLEGEFNENGLKIYRIYGKYNEKFRQYLSIYNPFVVSKIKRIMSEIRPDVVHAHNIHYHISYHSLFLASRYAKKVFLTTHDVMSFYQGNFSKFIDKNKLDCPTEFDYKVSVLDLLLLNRKRYNPFHNLLVKFYLSFVHKIITVSSALKEALAQNGITNTTVINNGIDIGSWNVPDGVLANVKESLGLNNSEFILFGGRLSGAKGGDSILRALKIIVNERPNAKLLIFGRGGSYIDKIYERADELKIRQNIYFAGWHGEGELKKYYGISNVVVVPSLIFDSFPTVNLQAFASKKPVVATCFGGSRELVSSGENGYIVNPFNVQILAEKISDLLSNKEKAKEFGLNGYNLVSKKYTLEIMVNNYLDLFNSFLNK